MINVQIIGATERIKLVPMGEKVYISFSEDELQALNSVEQMKPSVILLDYDVRKEQTDSYIEILLKVSVDSKIVVIADKISDEEVFACLIAGAKGYQNINKLAEYAVKMVAVVDAGEAWITRRMVAKLLEVLMQK